MFTGDETMAGARYPLFLGCRVNENQMARVDAVSRLRGVTRAEYVKQAALEKATADRKAELEHGLDCDAA